MCVPQNLNVVGASATVVVAVVVAANANAVYTVFQGFIRSL